MTELNILLNKTVLKSAACVLIFMTALVYAATSPSASDAFTDRRITTGAKIFRALLAADFDISRKTSGKGHLKLCLLYIDDDDNAKKAAATLRLHDNARIKKLDTTIDILSFSRFTESRAEGAAGVFLTQPLNDNKLNLLIERINEKKIVFFSPFEGDVERGVQSGLAVESRVRPYLNQKALQSAGIRLKSFFLRVAKNYEE